MRHAELAVTNECLDRLNNVDFISVRDSCVGTGLKNKGINDIIISPDSTAIIKDLIDDEFLNKKVSRTLIDKLPDKFIVFQAAEHKVPNGIDAVSKMLMKLKESLNQEIVLLPVGYAMGHGDDIVLNDIASNLGNSVLSLDDLSIWDIVYVIKNCTALIGTSLHAIITAISYGKPHFAMSEKVPKLRYYLDTWSFSPFNRCYNLESAEEIAEVINESDYNNQLSELSEKLKELVIINNKKIIDVIHNY